MFAANAAEPKNRGCDVAAVPHVGRTCGDARLGKVPPAGVFPTCIRFLLLNRLNPRGS
jgi:hypothetical protein